jgi:hypothetical protein
MATTYTDEIGERICEQVEKGLSLAKIAAMDGMPCESTICNWFHAHKEFEQKFFAAKRGLTPGKADEIDQITLEAIEFAKTADPKKVNVGAVVNAYNNRAQHKKWEMAVGWREKYGDKVQHTGGDGDGPVQIVVTRVGSK